MNRRYNTRRGLSVAQQGKFRPLVKNAWLRHCLLWDEDHHDRAAERTWYERELMTATGVHSTTALVVTADVFTDLLVHFATLAADTELLGDLAQEGERRMRWQIGRCLDELSYLECRTVDWAYARAIFTQMNLPLTIEETPAPYLQQLMIALDAHVRKLLTDRNRRLNQSMTRPQLREAVKHQAALEAAYT